MSATDTAEDSDESDLRVLLTRRPIYRSGNSMSVSFNEDALENVPFDVGDPANIFSLPDDRELVVTADTARYHDRDDAISRGSRKFRRASTGTILLTIPPDCFLEDFGFSSTSEAKKLEMAVTIDPVTRDLFLGLQG